MFEIVRQAASIQIPFDDLQVGDAFVFKDKNAFEIGKEMAKKRGHEKFRFYGLTMLLIARHEPGGEELRNKIKRLLPATEGIIANRLRRYPREQIQAEIQSMHRDGIVSIIEQTHRFKGIRVQKIYNA